jgi:16S rRNA (cytosine967-C5)-methyltransferase
VLVTSLVQPVSSRTKKHQSSSISPARLIAFDVLRRVEEEGAYASVLLASAQDDLDARDRALSNELTLGVLRRQLTLDHLISHYANRAASRLDPAVRIALRMGLYQLRFLSRIPPSAAVNEAVKLVRFARVRSADKLVNAVLRRAIREADFDPGSSIQDPLEKIAVETSHPRWLLDRWIKSFGMAEATALASANNTAAPVSFRVIGNKRSVLEKLDAAGASLEPSVVTRDAWRIKEWNSVLSELVNSGEAYVQDEASQLVALALEAQPGDRILDLCAAPGSKTTHIADLANSEATVVAGDIYPHRLRVVSNSARLQKVRRIHCVSLDGTLPLPFAEASFDRVLVDAPCSGTGTLRGNPEIRWRLSEEDIVELASQQRRLLSNAATLVKPDGRLVYSTCSLESEENEEVVSAFLTSNSSFRRAELSVDLAIMTQTGEARTWPHRQGTDGFFISAFVRVTAD